MHRISLFGVMLLMSMAAEAGGFYSEPSEGERAKLTFPTLLKLADPPDGVTRLSNVLQLGVADRSGCARLLPYEFDLQVGDSIPESFTVAIPADVEILFQLVGHLPDSTSSSPGTCSFQGVFPSTKNKKYFLQAEVVGATCQFSLHMELLPNLRPAMVLEQKTRITDQNLACIEKAGGAVVKESDADTSDKNPSFEHHFQSCENNIAESCSEVSRAYWTGKGVERDFDKSMAYAEKSCGLSHLASCEVLGFAYDGWMYPIEVDWSKSARFYEKACELGSAKGCTNAGIKYGKNYGDFKKDTGKSRALLEKGCEMSSPASCGYLGTFYEEDYQRDREQSQLNRAEQLYLIGCEGDFMPACRWVGRLYAFYSLYTDEVRPPKYFAKGCEGGDKQACKALEDYQ